MKLPSLSTILRRVVGSTWLAFAAVMPSPAQELVGGTDPAKIPRGLEVDFQGRLSITREGDYAFEGPVSFKWRGSRIQADRVILRDKRWIEATGDVLIVWDGNRIFGARMTYDLDSETGVIEDAVGEVLSEYVFSARRVEKVGPDRLELFDTTVTTCTQPVPYWSFVVAHASIRIEGYARMRHVRLHIGGVPSFYLPYLVWPVKEGRAAGLLMPEFHTSQTRGRAITQEFFLPLGRSADLTLQARYYARAGFGGGGELRFIPNANGSAYLSGFMIDDQVAGQSRHRGTYRQTQNFANGFRMVADVNLVSDPNYFADFERELNLVASPTVQARLEFTRNDRWTSLNVRELRREVLSTGLVQQTLPEIELRGRSRRLGSTPFYLSFESSVASIQQWETAGGPDSRADYLRGDVSPTITLPWTPWRWLDITPRVRYRYTYYSQSQDPLSSARMIVDEAITRRLWGYGVDFSGPKLFRIFSTSDGPDAPRFKHSIEPQLRYEFEQAFDRNDEIILFDTDIDRVSGSGDRASYALVQRLFARRPQRTPETASERSQGRVVMPGATTGDDVVAEHDQAAPNPPAAGATPREPVEIASLEVRQSRTFDRDQSFADLDGDGVAESSSPWSAMQLTGRLNPTAAVSLDLRSSYDILYERMRDVSVSTQLRNALGHLRFSLVHVNGLGVTSRFDSEGEQVFVPRPDSTQMRLTTGFGLLQDRLKIDLDGSYDAEPGPGRSHLPNKRWRVQYATQCCTFQFERVTTDFASIQDRRDFYIRVDLRGVGKILNLNY